MDFASKVKNRGKTPEQVAQERALAAKEKELKAPGHGYSNNPLAAEEGSTPYDVPQGYDDVQYEAPPTIRPSVAPPAPPAATPVTPPTPGKKKKKGGCALQ